MRAAGRRPCVALPPFRRNYHSLEHHDMTWAYFGDEHLRAIGELITTPSHRIIAIVGGALLDDTLRRTLAERLRDDKKMRDKLLGVNRPIGNPGPKNDLLFMLEAYDRHVWKAIDGINTTRNFFAHHLDASFDATAEEFVTAMNKLKLHEYRKHYPHHLYDEDSTNKIESVRNNRIKFVVNLKLCLIALMHDRVSHETWSNRQFTEEEIKQKREKMVVKKKAVKKKTAAKRRQKKELKRP